MHFNKEWWGLGLNLLAKMPNNEQGAGNPIEDSINQHLLKLFRGDALSIC